LFYIAPPRHPPIIHYLSLKSLDALVVLSGLETVRDRGLFFEIKSIFSGFLVGLKKETVATKKGVIIGKVFLKTLGQIKTVHLAQ